MKITTPKQPEDQPESGDHSISGYGERRPLWSRFILPEWLMNLVVACLVGVLNMLAGPHERGNRSGPEH